MNPEYQSPETQWDGDRHDRLAQRRAVEALRSGVPNADAVVALGSGQGDIEDRFTGRATCSPTWANSRHPPASWSAPW